VSAVPHDLDEVSRNLVEVRQNPATFTTKPGEVSRDLSQIHQDPGAVRQNPSEIRRFRREVGSCP
jgi:hypothetical protein